MSRKNKIVKKRGEKARISAQRAAHALWEKTRVLPHDGIRAASPGPLAGRLNEMRRAVPDEITVTGELTYVNPDFIESLRRQAEEEARTGRDDFIDALAFCLAPHMRDVIRTVSLLSRDENGRPLMVKPPRWEKPSYPAGAPPEGRVYRAWDFGSPGGAVTVWTPPDDSVDNPEE